MRYLKIKPKNIDHLYLEEVPEEYKFVELISKQYANTNEELKKYYLIGVEAAKKFKLETTEKSYDSKVAWIVKQTILNAIDKFSC
jgi:hypothetical protein